MEALCGSFGLFFYSKNAIKLPSVDCLLHKVKNSYKKIRFVATNQTSLIFLVLFVAYGFVNSFLFIKIHFYRVQPLSLSKQINHTHQMSCKINSLSPPLQCKLCTKKPRLRRRNTISFSFSSSEKQQNTISTSTSIETPTYTVSFKTQNGCKLGISRYPDFEYDADGGVGTGVAAKVTENPTNNDLPVSFDLKTLYIPPLTSSTTKFLGLPLPPFLKIDIVPEAFQGSINQESGKVNH